MKVKIEDAYNIPCESPDDMESIAEIRLIKINIVYVVKLCLYTL